jgi:peptidoglycan hydrolase CwlO-like protein
MKKSFFLFLLFVFISVALFSSNSVSAQSIEELENKIADLQAKINAAQNTANTLASQIESFDNQITLATLKIAYAEGQIGRYTQKISDLESNIRSRTDLLEIQIANTYKQGTSDPLRILFSSGSLNDIISRFKYAQVMQANNRRFLYDTQVIQSNFASTKTLVEESKVKLQSLKRDLLVLQQDKKNLLAQTKNDEANYQKLLSEAKDQLEAMRRFVNQQGGAAILNNQTFCDSWGCYYNQRDAEWGYLSLGNSNLSVAGYGCLISSSAMVATHYGKSLRPSDIARQSDAFFSNTGLFWNSTTVNGINIQRVSWGRNLSALDSELAAGRPVIVGLFSGPGHFIVIKSGSNGNYVMNDPYLENGHDVSFTSKYSLGNITDVEKVIVQ